MRCGKVINVFIYCLLKILVNSDVVAELLNAYNEWLVKKDEHYFKCKRNYTRNYKFKFYKFEFGLKGSIVNFKNKIFCVTFVFVSREISYSDSYKFLKLLTKFLQILINNKSWIKSLPHVQISILV